MVRKSVYAFMLLAFVLTGIRAQGLEFKETRTVERFNELEVCCGLEVYITEGTSNRIRVETNREELLKQITTEVQDNRLKVGIDSNTFKQRFNTKMKVYIEAKDLQAIHASSGSDVSGETVLNAGDISMSCSSGAKINVALIANRLDCASSSGSDLTLSGRASHAVVKASSGSDIDLSAMVVESAVASSSSGSNVLLHVTQTLTGKVSSGSDIVYSGNPTVMDVKKSSGGSVRRAK